MKLYTIILLAGIAMANFSCAYNKADAPLPVDTTISYTKDIKPILITNCFHCHSDTASHPDRPGYAYFNDYNELKTYALKPSAGNSSYTVLQARLRGVETPQMPFNQSPLPDSVIAKIESWIRDGAPNN